MLGFSSTCILAVSLEEGQTPLLIVHIKLFCPRFKFVTEVVLVVGDTTVEVPVNTVQTPVPIAGALAETTPLLAHIV